MIWVISIIHLFYYSIWNLFGGTHGFSKHFHRQNHIIFDEQFNISTSTCYPTLIASFLDCISIRPYLMVILYLCHFCMIIMKSFLEIKNLFTPLEFLYVQYSKLVLHFHRQLCIGSKWVICMCVGRFVCI
jgi:hypothetical protein